MAVNSTEDLDDPVMGNYLYSSTPSTDNTANIPLAYSDQPSNNKATRGAGPKQDLAFAGVSGLNIGDVLNPSLPSAYTMADVNVTPSGHVIEYNDTPGGERIRIKHTKGAGIDILPDGSIAVAVAGRHIITVRGDQTIVVMGNANYEFGGDLNFNVKGDFNLKCSNFNTMVNGNKTDTIIGSLRENISGNRGDIVNGNSSTTTLGSTTLTTLGSLTSITKGAATMAAQGKMQVLGGGALKMSAQGGIDITSTNINIGANSLTAIGNSGTIGGENIHLYGYNARLTKSVIAESMQADTLHGDLDGTAAFAQVANQANIAAALGGGGASIPPLTNTATNTSSTALPNGSIMTEYLTQSSKGIVNVTVDDVEIKKMMDRSQFNGGTSALPLSTTQVRSKLRDPANMANGEFTSNMVASGTLSPQFSQTSAPAVNRTVGKSPAPVRGVTPVGRGGNRESQGVFQPAPAVGSRQFVPGVNYFITSKSTITPGTLLADGVPLSTFIAGEGDRSTINHVTIAADRQQLARNLQLQAQVLQYVNRGPRSKFAEYTLKVIEGIYKPGPQETSTAGSLNELAAQGRCVVYELINNSTGKVDNTKTFELATSLKNVIQYDKLILDYDHFNPDGSINVQLIVVTPNLSDKYAASYKFDLETRYNNNVQSAELVEITTKPAGIPI